MWRRSGQCALIGFALAGLILVALATRHESFAQSSESKFHIPAYAKARKHKAIAANETGFWVMVVEAESGLDAEEESLFGCDELVQHNPFLDPSRQHDCVLVDVDDERLMK